MKAILRIIAALGALVLADACLAQAWPAKPVRMIVAFAPGGPADIAARLVGQKMTDSLGQQVVIENRGGAGGNIGAVAVAKSSPDGYTALLTTSALAVNVSLFPNPGYELERDFIPTALVAAQPNMIYVNANLPVKTLAEFMAYARGAKLSFASPGSGTTPHLTAENLFRVISKLDVPPIHYRGAGPAVAAVVAGDPPVGSGAISGPLAQIKAGKLRGLAVSSARRVATLPEVPTFAEAGFPGIEDYTWIAVFLPAGSPAAVVQALNASINRAVESAELREKLQALAFEPLGGSPQQVAEYVRTEVVKWGRVVRETGAKPE